MEFSIRDIKGIGPRKEALFARLHLTTVTDLLQYFPRDYEDRSHVWPIGQAPCGTGEAVLLCGTVASVQEARPRRGLSLLKVAVSDGTGAVELVWFNQAFKKRQFKVGMTLTAFGKLEWAYGRRQMNSPDTEEGRVEGSGFVPVYGLTDGLRQQDVRKAVRGALDAAASHPDILPGWDAGRHSAFHRCRPLPLMKRFIFRRPWRPRKGLAVNWLLKNSSICSLASYCVVIAKGSGRASNAAPTVVCSALSMSTCLLH